MEQNLRFGSVLGRLTVLLLLRSVFLLFLNNFFLIKKKKNCVRTTGKSLSEALIFASILSYCGLVDARISASEKDLPVKTMKP